jgi:hypothetical protein
MSFQEKPTQKQLDEHISRNDSKAFLSIHQMVVLSPDVSNRRKSTGNYPIPQLTDVPKVLSTTSSFVKDRAHSVLRIVEA